MEYQDEKLHSHFFQKNVRLFIKVIFNLTWILILTLKTALNFYCAIY